MLRLGTELAGPAASASCLPLSSVVFGAVRGHLVQVVWYPEHCTFLGTAFPSPPTVGAVGLPFWAVDVWDDKCNSEVQCWQCYEQE